MPDDSTVTKEEGPACQPAAAVGGRQGSSWPQRISSLLIAAGLVHTLYTVRLLWLMRVTAVQADFWLDYEHLFRYSFPWNVLLPRNAHCMIFPKLVWLANLGLFRGTETPLFVFGLALMALFAAMLIRLGLEAVGKSHSHRALVVVSTLTGTFWLAKAFILTSAGFIIIYALVMIGLLVAMRGVLTKGAQRCWRWVVPGCLLASLSFGAGWRPGQRWPSWAGCVSGAGKTPR